jgi:CheY-like chemotaxis protein
MDARGIDGHLPRPVRQSQLFDAIMAAIHRTRTPGSATVTAPAKPPVSACRGARVLLVEDNEVNQMVAGELLSEMGCVVEVAEDGVEAVEAMRRASFDIVLMDCQMPEMDGFAATSRIRELESGGLLVGRVGRVPIIALTANALKEDRERCLAAGMDDYLTKPLQPEKLVATMETYLGKRVAVAAATAPASGVPGKKAPLDFAPLLNRCSGKREFAEKILEKFRGQSAELLEALVQSAKERDGEKAKRNAHTLKGMAATVAAEPLKEAAAVAEKLSAAEDWAGVEAQVEALKRELEECLAFIPSMLSSAQNNGLSNVKR